MECSVRHSTPPPRSLAGAVLVVALVGLGCGGATPPAPLDEDATPLTLVASESFEFDPLDCAAAILIEAETGSVLFEQNADAERAPASLAKMMLELLVMDLVARGDFSLDDEIRASAHASRMGGSQVFLREGEVFPLEAMMEAIAIASANDACVAVAEHVAGQTDVFVDMMNRRAEDLGMSRTHYVNVHGLDDDPERLNVTTARDVVALGRALLAHAHILEWSSKERAPFRGGEFILENTNTLIGRFSGMDGIKTGYTERAGYNLCATAERKGTRYVSVVMGAESRSECAAITARILSRAFNECRLVAVATKGEAISDEPVVVEQSQAATIAPLASRDVRVLVPTLHRDELVVTTEIRDPLRAPLVTGSPVGNAVVTYRGEFLTNVPIVSDRAVAAKGMKAWFRGVFGG